MFKKNKLGPDNNPWDGKARTALRMPTLTCFHQQVLNLIPLTPPLRHAHPTSKNRSCAANFGKVRCRSCAANSLSFCYTEVICIKSWAAANENCIATFKTLRAQTLKNNLAGKLQSRLKFVNLAWRNIQFWPLDLQSHPPVTGVLKWEILGSALGSAPEVLREIGCSGKLGLPQGVLPRVLNVGLQQKEHSREHSLEHPQFPWALLGALPRAPRFPVRRRLVN